MDPAALVADTPRAQAAALREGRVTAVDLAAAAVAASRALDAEVNAFLAIDADGAHAAAQEADRRRAAGEDGPLLGVPIALKDDLDAAGHVTSWGTRSRRTPAGADGSIVAALRRAGAVPIGRTTLPELALYGFTESAFSGITRNPLDPTRTSGGSSGGSAAAVAGGAVGIATASDGAGSIRIPAACCGLVGIKPGAGRTPGGGWNGLSVQGCLTRRVADSALYLDLVGDFPSPLATAAEQDPPPLRIGVDLASPVTPALPLDPDLEAAARRSAELLAGLGHEVRDVRVRYGAAPAGFVARMLHGLATAAADVDDPALLETRTADVARIGRLVPDAAIGPARRQGETWGRRVLADLGRRRAAHASGARTGGARRALGGPPGPADDAGAGPALRPHPGLEPHRPARGGRPGRRVGRRAAADRADRRGTGTRRAAGVGGGTARARGAPDGARVSSPSRRVVPARSVERGRRPTPATPHSAPGFSPPPRGDAGGPSRAATRRAPSATRRAMTSPDVLRPVLDAFRTDALTAGRRPDPAQLGGARAGGGRGPRRRPAGRGPPRRRDDPSPSSTAPMVPPGSCWGVWAAESSSDKLIAEPRRATGGG